jgi:hypothetical protein
MVISHLSLLVAAVAFGLAVYAVAFVRKSKHEQKTVRRVTAEEALELQYPHRLKRLTTCAR